MRGDGMDFFEAVQDRHSIRAFSAEPVEPETLQRILEVVNRMLSAGNLSGVYEQVVMPAQAGIHSPGFLPPQE